MFIAIEATFLLLLVTIVFRFKRYSSRRVLSGEKPHGFSLVIPFRNEAHNLYALLASLADQKISIPYEVILINDGSTDDYVVVLEKATADFPDLQVVVVNNHFNENVSLSSKQQAIDTGVAESSFDWLVFTDADMKFNSGWLHILYESCNTESGRFVFGRTAIIEEKSLFSKFQALQLGFLFGNAWFLAHARIDSSCMGNNIAIEKKLYNEIGGQKAIGYSIVEDKKLLSVVRKKGVTPTPSKHFYAFAKTHPSKSMSEFTHQMIRWLKGGMQESRTLTVLITFFLMHLMATIFVIAHKEIISIPLLSTTVINWSILLGIFIFIFVKMKMHSKIGILFLYILFVPFEALYIIPALLFIKPKWKGRVVGK